MKILTANIAMGNPRADKLWGAVRSLMWFHNWRVLPFLISGGRLGRVFEYGSHSRAGRIEWFAKHSSLEPALRLVAEESPDVLVLNELLHQIHYRPLNDALARLGYGTVIWGLSPHHPDATISSVVASRLPVLDAAPMELPWGIQMGGGGGAAYVRLADVPVTVIGCHLAIGKGMQATFEGEIAALTRFGLDEQRQGRQVVVAGDFNAVSQRIQRTAGFDSLHLRTVTAEVTSAMCLPKLFQTVYDHIFIPKSWQLRAIRYPAFGSDHLAVAADANPSEA